MHARGARVVCLALFGLVLAWLRLRPTKDERLAAKTARSSKRAEGRGPLYVPVTRIWPLALGALSAERQVAGKFDASEQRFRPQSRQGVPAFYAGTEVVDVVLVKGALDR